MDVPGRSQRFVLQIDGDCNLWGSLDDLIYPLYRLVERGRSNYTTVRKRTSTTVSFDRQKNSEPFTSCGVTPYTTEVLGDLNHKENHHPTRSTLLNRKCNLTYKTVGGCDDLGFFKVTLPLGTYKHPK